MKIMGLYNYPLYYKHGFDEIKTPIRERNVEKKVSQQIVLDLVNENIN